MNGVATVSHFTSFGADRFRKADQLIAWPALLSMAAKPQLIIGAANAYWAKGTNISEIQAVTLESWARLFGLPLATSINE